MEQKTKEQERYQDQKSSLMGFLSVETTADNTGFIGALLVTDERGYPLEFRCTTPVRPTYIQRVLYGSMLKSYVSLELCGRRLLTEVQRKPALVVVQTEELLSLSDNTIPLFMIQRAGQTIETDSISKNFDRERVESTIGNFQPIIVISNKSQPAAQSNSKEFINELFRRFDLLEPFGRIKTALKALSESDPKYR